MNHRGVADRISNAHTRSEADIECAFGTADERGALKVEPHTACDHQPTERGAVLQVRAAGRSPRAIRAADGERRIRSLQRVASCVRREVGRAEELIDLATDLEDVVLAQPPELLGVPPQVVGGTPDIARGGARHVARVIGYARVLGRAQSMLCIPE